MRLTDFTFPHPVLTSFTDDVDSHINSEQSITELKDKYIVSVNFETDNQDLINFLENEIAVNVCEVMCTGTVYRKIYSTNEQEVEFSIPKKDVRGKVYFDCYLLSDQDLGQYNISSCHIDYADYNFAIEKGDLLGYYGRFEFHADINYEKLRAVSSFLQIEEDETVSEAVFVLEGPKIIVKLPTEDYKIYGKSTIGRNESYVSIFHSSIVLSALIYALYNIDDYRERAWAGVIETRMDEDELKKLSLEEKSLVPIIAQKLLGRPITRLMNQLDYINTKIS
jgi:uncharacterized protein YlxP (DUF503 family)